MNCRKCGAAIRQDARYCSQCGYNLASQFQHRCTQCGNLIIVTSKFCRHCGAKQSKTTCPRCWRPNRDGAVFCNHCGTRLAGKPAPHPYGTGRLPKGWILAERYIILQKIAQGGMAAVYQAISTSNTGPKVAIKEMSLQILQGMKPEERNEVIQCFQREFSLLKDLHHPNLVQALEYLEVHDRRYFVMEYLDGLRLWNISLITILRVSSSPRIGCWPGGANYVMFWITCTINHPQSSIEI